MKTKEQKRIANRKNYFIKYYWEHKKQINAHSKKYYQENKEKHLTWVKKYHQEHKEQRNEYSRKYAYKYRVKMRAVANKWNRDNPEKAREQERRYRANKLNSPGSHTLEQIQFLRNISGGFCPGHNRKSHYVGKDKLALDHIIALSNGGSDSIENIQMLCISCNSSKGAS